MKPIDVILAALGDFKRQVNGFVARCPAHDDTRPSLRVAEGDDGRVLVKCRAGCPTPKVLQAIGLSLRDLFPRNAPGEAPKPVRKRTFEIPDPPAPDPKWRDLAKRCFDHPRAEPGRRWLAAKLGVSTESLIAIRCGWIQSAELEAFKNKRTEGAFTFPERDGRGRIVGVSLRWPDGEKGFVFGGNRGLTIPAGFHAMPGLAVCVEGQSDTAALFTLGIAGVGRPSCNGGADALARLLRRREVVIVGENDRKPDGKTWPGRDGAVQIADKLSTFWKRPVYWALPPGDVKDVRAWLIRNGEEADFMAAIHFRATGADKAAAELERLRTSKQAGRARQRDFKAGA